MLEHEVETDFLICFLVSYLHIIHLKAQSSANITAERATLQPENNSMQLFISVVFTKTKIHLKIKIKSLFKTIETKTLKLCIRSYFNFLNICIGVSNGKNNSLF